MHKKTERLTVLTDIFSPDTAADGLEICPILPSPSFLSRQKSVPLKLRAPKTDYFCPRFVEDDAGIPGVFQGGRNKISAKEPFSALGVGSLMHKSRRSFADFSFKKSREKVSAKIHLPKGICKVNIIIAQN